MGRKGLYQRSPCAILVIHRPLEFSHLEKSLVADKEVNCGGDSRNTRQVQHDGGSGMTWQGLATVLPLALKAELPLPTTAEPVF